jgi:hypothetical protein
MKLLKLVVAGISLALAGVAAASPWRAYDESVFKAAQSAGKPVCSRSTPTGAANAGCRRRSSAG